MLILLWGLCNCERELKQPQGTRRPLLILLWGLCNTTQHKQNNHTQTPMPLVAFEPWPVFERTIRDHALDRAATTNDNVWSNSEEMRHVTVFLHSPWGRQLPSAVTARENFTHSFLCEKSFVNKEPRLWSRSDEGQWHKATRHYCLIPMPLFRTAKSVLSPNSYLQKKNLSCNTQNKIAFTTPCWDILIHLFQVH
jgi:hypothetical protein